ncbi:MAG TPA: hypothetical protein VMW47_05450 [Verrucomicrobiae bacterium]|nr:hypothetical protein [Verrucomicrobiae bacterium]
MTDETLYLAGGTITKSSRLADGTLAFSVSKAVGPEVDADRQVADPVWARTAMAKWFATGGNLREQHDKHRAIGKALTLEDREDGQWISGICADPVANQKVELGILRGLSYGVRGYRLHKTAGQPDRIVDGEIVEVSLVDRPANPTAKLVLAKAAGDGSCEFVEEFTDAMDAEKADAMTHSHAHRHADGHHRHDHRHGPDVTEHSRLDSGVRHGHNHAEADPDLIEDADEDKTVGADVTKAKLDTADRKALPKSDFAIPEKAPGSGSYPINDEAHARDALARSSGKPEEARVRAAVKRKYPDMDVADDKDEDKAASATWDALSQKVSELAEMVKAAKPTKPTKADPDPDDDGDDDMTPEGDTDHDYWNADGTPTAKGRAAGFTSRRRKRAETDKTMGPDLEKAVAAAVLKAESTLLEKVAGLEAELEKVKATPIPGAVRTRPALAAEASAEATRLRLERDHYLRVAEEVSEVSLAKGYRDLAAQRTDALEKIHS